MNNSICFHSTSFSNNLTCYQYSVINFHQMSADFILFLQKLLTEKAKLYSISYK